MRSEHDIRSMIDYLTARGGCDSDIAILRWVLGEAKSEWEQKYEDMDREHREHISVLQREKIAMLTAIEIKDAEIRRLKSEPDHK